MLPGFRRSEFGSLWQFTIVARPGQKRHLLRAAVLLFGFAFCGLIWRSLKFFAKLAEAVWLAIRVIYLGMKTQGFSSASAMI